MTQALELNDFQTRLLQLPEEVDAFVGGGRGGGKSYALALLALRHAEQYGARARILYLRKTYKGLADFELVTREIFGLAYGMGARYNAAEHVWKLPNGAYVELGQLESHADYQKFQGRSFSLLLIDEAGQYAHPELLDIMRSNLRGAVDVPIRMIVAANPGGPGHHWLAKRYVFKTGPWKPFFEEKSKRQWVYAPSTFDGNRFIDREQYRGQLESACPDDPELLRAWVHGDWAVNRGAYFAAVLDESRNAFDPFTTVPTSWGSNWQTWLAHDYGSAAPSVTYIVCKSPGAEHAGRFYPRDSLLLIDELAAHRRDDYSKGLGWTAATTAEAIVEMCARWSIKAQGVADDACFSNTGQASTIAGEFQRKGVNFRRARKADRITGWNLMRRMLSDAGKPDVPGLYISRNCEYFWGTVPHLARDQKRVEDVDSSGPDHGADACRYGLLRRERGHSVMELRAIGWR